MTIDERTARYIQTIADAAAQGTTSIEGMRVIALVMRGWTLDAAKHHVFHESE